jgi:hypothetical protein
MKVPERESGDDRLHAGDCIYDYGGGAYPTIRPAVHNECHRKRDLSGEYALLSQHFYYFGDRPVPLPEHLHPIIHRTQGHKSIQNQPYAQSFVDWIEGIGYWKNRLYGNPQAARKSSEGEDPKRPCNPRNITREDFRRAAPSCRSTMRSPAQSRTCKG